MNESEYTTMYEAEDTHWWYTSLHSLILQQLPQGDARQRILDAGCGTGRLLQLLSGHGAGEGCDISETALALCRKRGLAAVSRMDLNTQTPEHDRYDVITLIDVLYHAAILDDGMVLKKLHAALKPGGTLILHVPAYEWLRSSHDIAVHTGRRYLRKDIVKLLCQCGFTIEKATYRVSALLLPIAFVRVARRLLPVSGAAYPRSSDVKKHSPVANALLKGVLEAENGLLKKLSLPFGASIFVVAGKPPAGNDDPR